MNSIVTYRRSKVSRFARVIGAKKKVDPQQYREEHGRCPKGWEWDGKKCNPSGKKPQEDDGSESKPKERQTKKDLLDSLESFDPGADESKPEKKPEKTQKPAKPERALTPEEKQKKLKKDLRQKQKEKKAPERKKSLEEKKSKQDWTKKMRDLRSDKVPMEQKNELLNDLADKDWNAYRKEVDRLRETGELPSKEVAQLLGQIHSDDTLPDEVRNDPEKLKEILKTQQDQSAHEERVLQRMKDNLEDFEFKQELAEKYGTKPPEFKPLKELRQIEIEFGRELSEKDREKFLGISDEDWSKSLGKEQKSTRPGSTEYKIRKFFERLAVPAKPLIGASVETAMHKKKIVALLDTIAEELDRRGATKLATVVDAEASGLPEADKLPDGEKAKEWDRDWTQQTSDYRQDLGFPPYDKVRPSVKGDEAAN